MDVCAQQMFFCNVKVYKKSLCNFKKIYISKIHNFSSIWNLKFFMKKHKSQTYLQQSIWKIWIHSGYPQDAKVDEKFKGACQ